MMTWTLPEWLRWGDKPNPEPAVIASADPLPEYDLVIVLRDGSRCIDPVPWSATAAIAKTAEGRRAAVREWARGVAREGRCVEGPVNTFRCIHPEDISTITVQERTE